MVSYLSVHGNIYLNFWRLKYYSLYLFFSQEYNSFQKQKQQGFSVLLVIYFGIFLSINYCFCQNMHFFHSEGMQTSHTHPIASVPRRFWFLKYNKVVLKRIWITQTFFFYVIFVVCKADFGNCFFFFPRYILQTRWVKTDSKSFTK